MAFVSSNSTNSNCNSNTNEADNTAYGVSAAHTQCNHTSGDNLSDAMICAFLASQPNSPQLTRDDIEQIDPDDLEEIDLQWEMAMLTIRARRFIQMTGRKLDVNGQRVRFYRTKVECYNCHKNSHFTRECRALRNQENRGRENSRIIVTMETPTENALVAQDRIGSSSSSNSKVDSCSKSCVKAYATLKKQYDSLSSDYKRSQFNLVSYKAEVKLRDNALVENKKKLEKAEKERDELKLALEKFQNSFKSLNNLLESQVSVKFKTGLGYNAASSTAASPAVESFVNSSEMLENQENGDAVPPPFTGNSIPFKLDLTFMDEIVESENMDVITIVTPSNGKKVESNHESADVKNNGDAVEPKLLGRTALDLQSLRIGILMMIVRSGKINTADASVNTTVRPVKTAGSKITVSHPRPISNAYKKGFSQDTRPFNKYSANKNSIFNKKVNTVRVKDTTAIDRVVVSENKGKWVNAIKASACWVWKAKNSNASYTFNKYSYINARGISKSRMA
ncbi:ribonuclease H-like domain-containing protein [Tanacetum coccineum]